MFANKYRQASIVSYTYLHSFGVYAGFIQFTLFFRIKLCLNCVYVHAAFTLSVCNESIIIIIALVTPQFIIIHFIRGADN